MLTVSGVSDAAMSESHFEKQAMELWFSKSSTLWTPCRSC